jgi:hypothetical protein
MNTYLVPVTKEYQSIFTDIMVIYANNERDAYSKAKIKKGLIPITIMNYHDIPYDFFIGEINFSESFFSVSRKYDIIKQALSLSTEGSCMEIIDIYNYMYWGDYNLQIQKLADKALPEKWSFEDKNDNYILKNYLKYTFIKLQEENKVIETDTYCAFDTGLFSKYYEPIYAYGEINKNVSENSAKWYFKEFKDTYELGNLDIEKFPERADYFSDPSRLVFNWHLNVNKNYKHILDDLSTSQRLPDSIKNSDRPLETLKGVIDTAIQKVIANYKLAVPHYYQNKIQLLVPLCFGKDDTPNVALVLDLMKNGYYQATTCLSMEMAYMDARLIAKPESNWLVAENITE